MPHELSLGLIIFRLCLAFFLTGIIGLEREWYRKPAGLRTLTIVGLASTLFTLISFRVRELFPSALVDPTRIAAQVVTGLGFLGAGTIIRAKGEIVGLTTAASIFIVAAIGMACAYGLYTEAIATTVLTLMVFFGLSYGVQYIESHSKIPSPLKELSDTEKDNHFINH